MKIAKQLAWIAFCYGVAVAVATGVTVGIVVALSAFPDNGKFGSYIRVIGDLPALLAIGGLYTSLFGFPGWLIAVIIAQIRNIRGKRYFVFAGGANALLAHGLLGYLAGKMIMESYNFGFQWLIFLWSFIGGLCGGWTYWRLAVVRFGKWQIEN